MNVRIRLHGNGATSPKTAETKESGGARSSSQPRAESSRDHFDAVGKEHSRSPDSAVKAVRTFHAAQGISPELLREKFKQMGDTALQFFRMNPQQFQADLSGPYAKQSELLPRTAPTITLNGDPHIGNFGSVRGPDGKPIWALNDFDQVRRGSPERDLERLTSSVVLVARANGLSESKQRELVTATARGYFAAIQDRASHGAQPAAITKGDAKGEVHDLLEGVTKHTIADAQSKLVQTPKHGAPSLKRSKDVTSVSAATAAQLKVALNDYAEGLSSHAPVKLPLQVLDVAEKLGGGSSFGLPRFYALVAGAKNKDEPVVLELKTLLPTGLADGHPRAAGDEARSVVEAQRTEGAAFNPLTGATTFHGRGVLVREREPEKATVALDGLSAGQLEKLAEQAGLVLGRAHTQSDDDAASLRRWVGNDEDAATKKLVSFSIGYADQTVADWSAFKATV